MRLALSLLLCCLLTSSIVSARAPDDIQYRKVVKHFDADRTVMGERISYPKGDPVNIQSLIVTLRPGESTGWHKHGVPTYGYILSGVVEVS